MIAPKKLGFWMCMALVMGNMIGSGVFLLPASLAPYGWNAVIGWIVTIAGAAAVIVIIIRLTRRLPEADGPHGFVDAAFGPLPAFLIAWGYWISVWVGNAAIATAAVSYLSIFAPGINAVPMLPSLLTIGLVWTVTLVNLFGARSAGGFQLVTTLLKLIPLAAAVVITLVVVGSTRGAALAPLPAHGLSLSAITASASLTLWAMLGFESASLATSQIDRPAITIPRAMLAGAGLAGVVYLIACSGIALLLPAEIAAASHAPFADFVGRYWGPGPATAVALFAAISAIGALNGLTLVVGAIPLSLARAGSLPAWFGVTSRAGTPVRAILVGTALTTVLLLLNAARGLTDLFTFLALMSTSATLFLYFGVALASFKLRIGGLVGAIATVYTLWTFWGAGIDATGWSSLLLLAGVPAFVFAKRSTGGKARGLVT